MREGGGGAAAQRLERGGGAAAQGEGIRGRAARVRGASGPDRVSRPNSLTPQLPTPVHESNQKFYCFTIECFPKNLNPCSTGPGRENKEKKE
jgi:hypothetical protein